MRMRLLRALLAILLVVPFVRAQDAVRVACVGDSITFGSGLPDRARTTYPLVLDHLLGERYEVRNFGVSGATLLAAGDRPWLETDAAREAFVWQPDVIVVKLGTNDSKQRNWSEHGDEFEQDAIALVQKFQALEGARVLLCTPVPAWTAGDGIDGRRIATEIVPALRRAASATGVELLDLHTPNQKRQSWFPDGVHPNPHGAESIARSVAERLRAELDWDFTLQNMLRLMSSGVRKDDFHGFEEYRFKNSGTQCRVVLPRIAAKGRPWIWRARFYGHEPQFDRALLERGWHVVYADVGGLYGNAEALKRWDGIYWLMTQGGLAERPLLEGMSRGGLPVYEWAKAHPDRVLGIYADNPVCDPRSWPGGAGASARRAAEWSECVQAHGGDESVFTDFATRGLEQLVQAGVPILHVVGEADSVVPVAENSDVVEARYRQLGGSIQVIRKPGQDHHPHSLPNPDPIVQFALRAAGLESNPCVQAQPSVEWRGGPAGWGGGTWWEQHEKLLALGAANPDLEVVFLGDSITQSFTGSEDRVARSGGARAFDRFYGTRKAASFGLSGDRTEHLLWRIQNGEFDAIDPRLIVLMIGVNNILTAGDDGESIAAGIAAVVHQLRRREPQAEVLLLGSFPTKEAGSWQRQQTEIVHARVAPLGDLEGVRYHDLRRRFVLADGSLDPALVRGDGVHLAGAGYEAWAQAIEPVVREILGEDIEQEEQPDWLKDAARVAPSERQLAWQALELTCFIHFGINTFTDREWGAGEEDPALFNPTQLDAEQWVLTAKAAGMKLMLLTAKHHDGFCLWPSRYTPHSVASSPWKNGRGDVVREVADACRKHGMKLGVYLSPADLNAIERGVYGDGSEPIMGSVPTQVEGRPFPDGAPVFARILNNYDRYFMNQLYELLTEYGPIDEVWFDGANPKPGTGQTYDREAWYGMIRQLQPQAVIAIDGPDVRWIGNEGGHARQGGEWSVIPVTPPAAGQVRVRMIKKETEGDLGSRAALEAALANGAELRWYPAEMDTSVRGGWFYHGHEDGHPKASVKRLFQLFETSFGGNAVSLLNVPPDRRGLIHEEDARRLAVFGDLTRAALEPVHDSAALRARASAEVSAHPAGHAGDGDMATWWQPAEGQNRAWLELDLGEETSFNMIQLREALTEGQRVESYLIEGYGAHGWEWLGEGTTIGNRSLLRVPLARATKLRVHITSSRLCPTLAEVSVHRAPEIPEPVRPKATTVHTDVAPTRWKIRGASSEQPDTNEGAAAAIDNDPGTLWHSRWRPDSPAHPHWLEIDLGETLELKGFHYLPRSDANRNGTVLAYRLELSTDGATWHTALETDFENMQNDPSERRVFFEAPIEARYLRFTALSEISGQGWASAAELGIVTR